MKTGILRIVDLFDRSERRADSTCWHWLRAMSSDKVSPRIWTLDYDRIDKRTTSGPRAVWFIKHKSALGSRLAFMTCCNSSCVNPEHVGSVADKAELGLAITANGKRKGKTPQRMACLAKAWACSGTTPTSPEIVAGIRAMRAPQQAIAHAFGVHRSTVSNILRGISHRESHVIHALAKGRA